MRGGALMSDRQPRKVAFVTGGSSGIGKAAAILFARRGYATVLVDLDEAAGVEVQDRLRAEGCEALFVPANVALDESIGDAVAQAVAHFGRLDCAFNAAGIDGESGRMTAECSVENWHRLLAVNLTGYLAQHRALFARRIAPLQLAYGNHVSTTALPTIDARLTDHSEHNLGSTYCWQSKEAKQFFCVTLSYGKPYNQLGYPKDGEVFASRFRILYSTSLRYADDPNLFVNEYIWRTYRQTLSSAPTMNDLLWLPNPYRLERFLTPQLGRLLYRTKDDPFSLDNNLESYGVGWDSPIDYVYATGNQQAIAGLREDLAQLANLAQRFTVNGEECVYWRKPLEGDWKPNYGKGVPTLHNVNGWLIAIAFLDAYRNERRVAVHSGRRGSLEQVHSVHAQLLPRCTRRHVCVGCGAHRLVSAEVSLYFPR